MKGRDEGLLTLDRNPVYMALGASEGCGRILCVCASAATLCAVDCACVRACVCVVCVCGPVGVLGCAAATD